MTIFQRGAMDGLAAVPPVDDSLKPLRPRLALSAAQGQGSTEPGLLDLQTGFGKVQNDLGPAEAPAPGEDVVEVKARTAYGDITVRRCVNAG